MADAADMAERHRDVLTELSGLGLALARDLQGRALAAADDAAACDLALAFHRISRSVRQTLALEARLERERQAAAREAARDAARESLARVQRKRAEIRRAVGGLIWTEAEGDEAEALFETLEALVMDESFDEEAFLAAPVEACIERIRADLGLAVPANGEDEATQAAPDLVRESSG